ncbi:TPA: His/Gly/Thr/Pro-type tRNA ligase C-terminal domain-containing protein, partial [Legionella pneumophila]
GIRANFDLRNEKIGFKIREHTLQKIPYLLVVGDKEVENCQVAVRTRDGIDLGVMTIDTICDTLTQEIIRKGSI